MNTATETNAERISLPWPPKDLSPNARVHWSKKSKSAKAYRKACWALVKEAGLTAPKEGPIHLWLDFYPPCNRKRDDDNLVAIFKSGRDGIADALGVDDNRFICHPFLRDELGGFVKFRITESV
jgi:crossover junction endodeoxyribonuclease RusA